jgi:hypothetical protein
VTRWAGTGDPSTEGLCDAGCMNAPVEGKAVLSETKIQLRIAQAIAPSAFAALLEDPAKVDDAMRESIAAATVIGDAMTALLAEGGFAEEAGPLKGNLKQDMERAKILIEAGLSLLDEHESDVRGDLDRTIKKLEAGLEELDETIEDIACDRCGEYGNDGEGYDGLCGNCADSDEDDDEDRFARSNEEWPTVGDGVGMTMDDEVRITVASIPLHQPNLQALVWTIVDENGDRHLVEDDGTRWITVSAIGREDVVGECDDAIGITFSALFIEDGVDDGDGAGTRNWRGVLIRDGEPLRSADVLSHTAQEACLDAVDLLEEAGLA